ncbi:vanin 2 [Homo sapiens]|uniref:pantetheine hydrolase VNN2 isoform X5 n=1 Tax=Homo sapiens TaxID=9606 RepID=UPI0001737A82|nr:pantetheine hydrolase VNN2 isoform X5 [Homo sapiens]KAI2543885.1 vanin 2 [Homo sapiens]KAI4019863.1 vanin 2 [Homo sapiens]BAG30936.1 GPI-80 variant protein 3 [Homo sapiens]|eukprot:NP_001229279.1 vascular non-inflammatory molecule 2 isoform 3 precursor [Homo sapiens]
MVTSSFPISVAVFALITLQVGTQDSFIAAVYEHAVILPNKTETPVSQEDALNLMNENIDILETAIKQAAEQGARIIVTPEDALYGWKFTRETVFPYLEDIPDPQVNWIPCQDPHRFGHTPVQARLSCLAKDNSIYVLANLGDKKPCNSRDSTCPPNGYFQYNTNVVYNTEGKLVARYHKVCTMLKCKTTNLTTCGRPVETASTRFEMFSLSGTFGTEYVFPEVLLTEIHLSPGKFEVLKDGRLVNKNGSSGPILTVSLFGRWYTKDSLYSSCGTSNSAITYLLIFILLMIIALQNIVML